ncbi:hypothetical protein F511_47203 [Dorcoceras hygrometricum]|uniref:Uncharacterized protein n=1 Tax=Dorcoceras hygrometricum TaxID=472368 RepID=A0A2Z6ZRM0_9LAMI|nr:hypothetical protein F511_47203 [Dorcoceras hygrometricum]
MIMADIGDPPSPPPAKPALEAPPLLDQLLLGQPAAVGSCPPPQGHPPPPTGPATSVLSVPPTPRSNTDQPRRRYAICRREKDMFVLRVEPDN